MQSSPYSSQVYPCERDLITIHNSNIVVCGNFARYGIFKDKLESAACCSVIEFEGCRRVGKIPSITNGSIFSHLCFYCHHHRRRRRWYQHEKKKKRSIVAELVVVVRMRHLTPHHRCVSSWGSLLFRFVLSCFSSMGSGFAFYGSGGDRLTYLLYLILSTQINEKVGLEWLG